MKKHLVFALVPLLALGCGEEAKDENGDGIADGVREPDSVTVVTPSTPKGTVSGQVLGTDLKPLADVSVEMTIGSSAEPVAATTDAKGNFEYTDVPAGAQVLLTFSKANYATLRATSTVPSSAGNVPINNGNASFGPITLAHLDGTLNFLVVTPQGRPAVGARATIEATPAGSIVLFNGDNTTRVVSNVVVEATANEQGLLTFSGIPGAAEMARLQGGQYRLWVSPMVSTSTGLPETGGFVSSYSGGEIVGNSTTRLINLPFTRPTGGTLNVESSNVGSLRGATDRDPLRNLVRPGEPIHLFFNQPVQQGSLLARLTDEYARESLTVNATVGNGGYSATITPNLTLVEGKEYNLDLRAVSAEGGSIFTRTGFFFVGDPTSARAVSITDARYQETTTVAPASGQLNSGETVYVNFNYPISREFIGAGNVYVHVSVDIGGPNPGVVGDYPGEVNNPVGFELFSAEPTAPIQTRIPAETPVFQIDSSGYTTRWAFTFAGANAIQNVSFSSLNMVVSFSKLPSRYINGTYESFWGQSVTSDLPVTGMGQMAVPVSP